MREKKVIFEKKINEQESVVLCKFGEEYVTWVRFMWDGEFHDSWGNYFQGDLEGFAAAVKDLVVRVNKRKILRS